tara:strand:+ start:59 stop:247 length:189 start_codon:yes stop_codon:yes gene_type:complete
MNQTFEPSWLTLLAHALNLVFVLMIISSPFLIANWWKKREKRMNERFDQLEAKIDTITKNEP